MSEKRFTIDEDGNITDTINDRCLYVENRMTECDYFVKLLNEQHETIQQSKELIKTYYNENSDLIKENEQLKQQIGNLEHTRDFCADVCADCERLEKENEQLKIQRKNTTKEFQKLLDFIRSKELTLTEYEEFKNSGDV